MARRIAQQAPSEPVRSTDRTSPRRGRRAAEEAVVVPVVREEVRVAKRAVETGRVRIVKRVREEEQLVERPLLNEEVEVRRVSVERFVDDVPIVRQEGDTLIVPIVEEVLVVEKRLMLKEELHIRKRTISKPFSKRVALRVEEADVQRLDPAPPQTTRPPRK